MPTDSLSEICVIEYLKEIEEPRTGKNIRHLLIDILVISLCGVIAGMKDWEDIHEFGKLREDVFRKFLKLPYGIPSHDTINRVLCLIDSDVLSKTLMAWTNKIRKPGAQEVIAIDGKTIRRSLDLASNKNALHILSAFASEQKLTLGQVATEEKSNEITAIPLLLKSLDLEDCIVTIDAMGCQKEVAKAIREKKADYLLCTKGNQGRLLKNLEAHFEEQVKSEQKSDLDYFEDLEVSRHGRNEKRSCYASPAPLWRDGMSTWEDLKTVAMIKNERLVNGKLSTEIRYYISSLPVDAKKIARAARAHWAIENSLHWILDVIFGEDQCRKRNLNATFNFSILRKFALNLLQSEKTKIGSIKGKQRDACFYETYLLKVLGLI